MPLLRNKWFSIGFLLQKLQGHLAASPILTYPDFSQPFVVETDTSDIELGAILSQQGHVIEYASRVSHGEELHCKGKSMAWSRMGIGEVCDVPGRFPL